MRSFPESGSIAEINAVGRDGFYNELIEMAGGVNVYDGILAFPRLSRESVLFLNPDVIIDVLPDNTDQETARHDWDSLRTVSAVRNRRVYFLTDSADTIPGPRSVQTLSRLSAAFHPE
jgi:iron complex transport system substrate-binding protein